MDGDVMAKNEERRGSYAEESVIGALLIDPEGAAPALFDALTPEDFRSAACRNVFSAARGLWLKQATVDPVTILHATGDPEGYAAWFAEAMRNTPTAANCLEYAEIVRDQTRLALIREHCATILFDGTSLQDAQKELEAAMTLLTQKRRKRRYSMAELVDDFFARLNRLDGRRAEFVDWGMECLTESLDTELGDFVVLGGYPSAGKTLLALQCAQAMAQKYRVGFVSLETGKKKLTNRIMAAASGTQLWSIKHNVLNRDQWRALSDAGEVLYNRTFWVEEAAGDSADEIRTRVIAGQYQIIFVDYLQLVNEMGSSRYETVTEISRKLHTMAQELGVLVVALAQLTRPEKSARDGKPVMPGMASIRESGQVEQDADAIVLLYKKDPTDKQSPRLLRIAKNKEGEVVEPYELLLHGATQTFAEVFPTRPASNKPRGKKPDAHQDDQEELPL